MPSSAFPLSTTFDPAFGTAAEKLRAAAAAKGITTHYISGVRSLADQQQLYANYQAGQRGQSLPYPARGRVPLAAVPGTSMHERGLAADIEADDPSQEAALRSMAPTFGLRTIGPSDPDHFEMARGNIPKGGGAPGTFAFGGGGTPPVQVASADSTPAYAEPAKTLTSPALSAINNAATPPGHASGNMTHEQFIRNYAQSIGLDPNLAAGIAGAEGLHAWSASNPNAGSYIDRTNGQPWSFGDFQLNTRNGLGTQALKAGIDPRDPNQWQAADKFALDQMKSGGVKPWSGDPVAAAYLKSGAVPAGTTSLNTTAPAPAPPSGPMDPSAQAGGPGAAPGTAGSTVNPAIPAATAPQNTGNIVQQAFTRPPSTQVDKDGNPIPTQSPAEKAANAVGGLAKSAGMGGQASSAPQESAPMLPTSMPDSRSAMLAGPSQQLLTSAIQSGAKPLTWSQRPYGTGQAGPQIPGMTLNQSGYYG